VLTAEMFALETITTEYEHVRWIFRGTVLEIRASDTPGVFRTGAIRQIDMVVTAVTW